ncbi:MAG: MBL fold metallo-hydrolase [Myxococcota bacterium]|nr:MBL fold metallo-hydrolase [Myxococcota bacterium]
MSQTRVLAAGAVAAMLSIACSAPSFPPPGSVAEVADRIDALRQELDGSPGPLPVSFAAAGTATQRVPVELLADGFPEAPDLDMSHPVFVAEWPSGSQLVVDPGLATRACPDFGTPAEWVGGEEIVCAGERDPWAERIRPDSVAAVVFSHLHVDHVSGLSEICRLCGDVPCQVPVALSSLQETSDETHEAAGRGWLDEADVAGCIVPTRLGAEAQDDGRPRAIAADLPGAFWMPLPGHTPGSQLTFVFRRVEGELVGYVIGGDVVNYAPAICEDGHPKPWLYRTFVVREDEERQAWNRALLRELDARGYRVLVNHHLDAERTEGRLCPPGEAGQEALGQIRSIETGMPVMKAWLLSGS